MTQPACFEGDGSSPSAGRRSSLDTDTADSAPSRPRDSSQRHDRDEAGPDPELLSVKAPFGLTARQLELLEQYYGEHATESRFPRKGSAASIGIADLTGLSEREVQTFCRVKKLRVASSQTSQGDQTASTEADRDFEVIVRDSCGLPAEADSGSDCGTDEPTLRKIRRESRKRKDSAGSASSGSTPSFRAPRSGDAGRFGAVPPATVLDAPLRPADGKSSPRPASGKPKPEPGETPNLPRALSNFLSSFEIGRNALFRGMEGKPASVPELTALRATLSPRRRAADRASAERAAAAAAPGEAPGEPDAPDREEDGEGAEDELKDEADEAAAQHGSKRFKWNAELHQCFLEAIDVLRASGGPHMATPQKILHYLKDAFRQGRVGTNTLAMTRHHVASHLQKHRIKEKQRSDATPFQPSPMGLVRAPPRDAAVATAGRLPPVPSLSPLVAVNGVPDFAAAQRSLAGRQGWPVSLPPMGYPGVLPQPVSSPFQQQLTASQQAAAMQHPMAMLAAAGLGGPNWVAPAAAAPGSFLDPLQFAQMQQFAQQMQQLQHLQQLQQQQQHQQQQSFLQRMAAAGAPFGAMGSAPPFMAGSPQPPYGPAELAGLSQQLYAYGGLPGWPLPSVYGAGGHPRAAAGTEAAAFSGGVHAASFDSDAADAAGSDKREAAVRAAKKSRISELSPSSLAADFHSRR